MDTSIVAAGVLRRGENPAAQATVADRCLHDAPFVLRAGFVSLDRRFFCQSCPPGCDLRFDGALRFFHSYYGREPVYAGYLGRE